MADTNTACKLLFIASKIKLKDLSSHIQAVSTGLSTLPWVLIPSEGFTPGSRSTIYLYESFALEGQAVSTEALKKAERSVRNDDILNLQFTSGELKCSSRGLFVY